MYVRRPYVPPAPWKPPAVDFGGYTGVRIRKPKSLLSLGEKDDVAIYRNAKGGLSISAASIDFIAASVRVNGQAVVTGGSGSNPQQPTEPQPPKQPVKEMYLEYSGLTQRKGFCTGKG